MDDVGISATRSVVKLTPQGKVLQGWRPSLVCWRHCYWCQADACRRKVPAKSGMQDAHRVCASGGVRRWNLYPVCKGRGICTRVFDIH